MEPLKIYLIDDHKLFIEGVLSLLEDEPEVDVVGYSLDPHDFLTGFDLLDVDVFLVDINMPKMSGIVLTDMMMKRNKETKILALTMHNDYQHIERMFSKGVLGYILKSTSVSELVTAVKKVYKGERYIGSDIQDVVLSQLGDDQTFEESVDVRKSRLTPRETEILLLIIREIPNKEIAKKLFISERTVETHRKSIMTKTNTKSTLGLYKYAIDYRLVPQKDLPEE